MQANKNNYCIIMAGGIGSRFWPMSRQHHPKQFLDVLGTGRTLLQMTYDRFETIIPAENIYIVTNKSYEMLVMQQLPGISKEQVLLEPARRNTAPCIAYAASKIASKNKDAVLVVAPSDHLITGEAKFHSHIMEAMDFAGSRNSLLTLGIKPNRPDTGYGYIQFQKDPDLSDDSPVRKVKTFTEKPNIELAKSFVSSGEFLWNSGIFIWSANAILTAFSSYLPEMYAVFQDGEKNYYTESESAFIDRAYAQCTNISIDYGILEKAPNVFVIPSDFGWSDLGTWGSLYENSEKDSNGNAVIGKNVMLHDSENCIVNMPKDKLAVIHGMKDYIIVESDNILLICHKNNEQDIRQMVTDVRVNKGEEFT